MPTVAKHVLFCVIAAGLLAAVTSAEEGQDDGVGLSEMPSLRAIPGITVDDQFPTACVGCHVNYQDMNLDTRLSTLMKDWSRRVDPRFVQIAQSLVGADTVLTGVHPEVDVEREKIPAICLSCHEGNADSPMPLVPFLHRVHLDDEGEGVFLRIFQGECTHCHKLDKATGRWSVPDAMEVQTEAVE